MGTEMDVSYEAQRSWPRKRQKVACPECGLTGYIGGDWAAKHAEHVTCTCGQVVTERGLPNHRVGKARHGQPCPPSDSSSPPPDSSATKPSIIGSDRVLVELADD